MKAWAVYATTGGAHEADSAYSIWSSSELAYREVQRLLQNNVMCGCNDGEFRVVEIELDQPRDVWIGGDD